MWSTKRKLGKELTISPKAQFSLPFYFCNCNKISIFAKCWSMGRKEKLLSRFLKLPKDFTFDEIISLLGYLGYSVHNKGKTSGSRIRFKNDALGIYVDLHKPHPGSIMKQWMMRTIYDHLKMNKLI